MRWTIFMCLVGCNFRNPTVEITSPPTGTVIRDHGSAQLELKAWDIQPASIELAIDGAQLDENLSVTPRLDGRECNPCNLKVVWPTKKVGEGLRVITAFVIDADDNAAAADIAVTFDDVPEIIMAAPQDEDLRGVGSVNVQLEVLERGALTAELLIDGVSAGTRRNDSCRDAGCSITWPWDTRTVPAGPHELKWIATDAHGHKTEAKHTVILDDIVQVTGLKLTNTYDDAGVLEIEVYAFDNLTGAMLGCAGSAHGLGGVDFSDTQYNVSAVLVDATKKKLGASALANAVRFEVWEDDDAPVCPAIMNPQGNNLVGASPAKFVTEWRETTTVQTYGNAELQIAIGRPLTY